MVEGLGDLIVRDELPISARFGECIDIKEFIIPHSLSVKTLAEEISLKSPTDDDFIRNCWEWVAHNISYPKTDKRIFIGPGMKLISEDFWALPYETIRDKAEDCDGRAMLLTSMLRNRLPPNQVLAALGNLYHNGVGGHAYVVVNRVGKWYVLETTLKSVPERPWVSVERATEYEPAFYFNDRFILASKSVELILPMKTGTLDWLAQYFCDVCQKGA